MSMTLGDFKKVAFSRSSDTLIVLDNGSDELNGEFVFDSDTLIFVVDFSGNDEYSLQRFYDLVARYAGEITDDTILESFDNDDSNTVDFTDVRIVDGVIVIYMD